MNPRREAQDRVHGAYAVRVLEPSPPPVTEPPWFADDPVGRGATPDGRPILSPVTTGDLTWDELCRTRHRLSQWCADRWLGAWRDLLPLDDVDTFVRTRVSWHTLAEHVLAPARYAATGKIGLRYTRAGFGTPWFDGSGPEQLRVRLGAITRDRGDRETTVAAVSVGVAADLAGVAPGAPRDVYEPTTALDVDAPMTFDLEAAARLGDWFGFGDSVLEQARAEADATHEPSRVQLWPEHFDLAFDAGDERDGRRGTFGASPGDAAHPEPYLYVTHWGPAPSDPFWNDEHFDGASLPLGSLVRAADQRTAALEFFRAGRAVLDRL